MNKQTLALFQQMVENATQALERLEAAIDEQDNYKIGARLFELQQVLKAIKDITQEQNHEQ